MNAVTGFDERISAYAAALASRSPVQDFFLVTIAGLQSFKLLPLFLVLLWLWGRRHDGQRARSAVVGGALGSIMAICASRIVQDFGPQRDRPADVPALHFTTRLPEAMKDFSSFPSDTLAIASALAIGIWCADRRWGLAAFGWCVFIAAGKVYTGFHYVTDTLTGSAIGLTCGLVAVSLTRRTGAAALIERIADRHSRFALPLAFVVMFQITTYLGDVRIVGRSLERLVSRGQSSALTGEASVDP